MNDMEDNVHWTLNRNGCFIVQSYYKALRGIAERDYPWKAIWRVKAPTNLAVFMTATLEKVLTIGNLIN